MIVSNAVCIRGSTHRDDAFDDGVSVVLRIGLLMFQEHVDYALLLRVSASGVTHSPLVVDKVADERVTPGLQPRQISLDAAEAVDPPQHREEIPHAECAAHYECLLDDLLEPVRVAGVPARGERAQHHVEYQLEEPGPEGDPAADGAVLEQVLDEGRDLGAAVRGEAGGREELDGEEPAQAAPVVSVGGPRDGGEPVPEMLPDEQPVKYPAYSVRCSSVISTSGGAIPDFPSKTQVLVAACPPFWSSPS
jgi:hypothetical protein